jgi:hypothetical protein
MDIRRGYSPASTEKLALPEKLSTIGGMPTPDQSTREALESAISKVGGTKSLLMQKLNEQGWDIKSHNVIGQWLENGVPPKYCPDIEALTGVSCESLCPDVPWGLVRDRRASKRAKQQQMNSNAAGR